MKAKFYIEIEGTQEEVDAFIAQLPEGVKVKHLAGDRNNCRPTGVRAGLLKGRLGKGDARHPANPIATPFYEAIEQASVDDLQWALNLLVKNPNAKRTYRVRRINAIAYRLDEIAGVKVLESGREGARERA